jgi:RNA polymerase sigma-70 factor, ECF subfamily
LSLRPILGLGGLSWRVICRVNGIAYELRDATRGEIEMSGMVADQGVTGRARRGSVYAISSPLTHTGSVESVAGVRTDCDEDLVDALRLREPTAPERLIARYGDRAYRLAVRITGNARDAEEVVQDAILNVVRKIDTFRGDSSLRSWVYRITVNAAYEKLRGGRHRRDEISLDDVLPVFNDDGYHADTICDWSESIHDPAVQSELRAALIAAIGDLPAKYRAVIVMRDVEGMSMTQVAACAGTTVAAAKIRAHRARLFLRKRLSMFMADVSAPGDQALLR